MTAPSTIFALPSALRGRLGRLFRGADNRCRPAAPGLCVWTFSFCARFVSPQANIFTASGEFFKDSSVSAHEYFAAMPPPRRSKPKKAGEGAEAKGKEKGSGASSK